MKKSFVFLGIVLSLVMSLVGCAGSKNENSYTMYPPKWILTEAQNRALDSLLDLGVVLAKQDGLAWVATDSLTVDLPESKHADVKGWVAQGDFSNGFCIFYGKDSTGLFQIARYDFRSDGFNRAVARTELPEGEVSDLVRMNDSAYNFLKDSGAGFDVKYNTYIIKNGDKYTFYGIPGSTSKYAVLGGSVKMDLSDSGWVASKLHKSPMGIEWASLRKSSYLIRSSSLGDIPNEADFAQYFIYERALPTQYISTNSYMYKISRENMGKVSVQVIKREKKPE